MSKRVLFLSGWLAFATLAWLVQPAAALIQVLTPLQNLIGASDFVFTAKIERLDPAKPSAVLNVAEQIKGRAPFTRLPINLTGDKESDKYNHTPQLLKRLAADLPLIGFVQKQGKNQYMLLAFSNGTWFQVIGTTDGDQIRWAYTHCEVYLRRTYAGTTDELKEIATGVVAGKRKAPAPNPKEPAGFGPEIPPPKAAE